MSELHLQAGIKKQISVGESIGFQVEDCPVVFIDDHLGETTHQIVVVIPAYNEDRFIGSVVLKARRYASRVLVVDDGSSDCTAQIARDAGAQVISHAHNKGKGAALNTAFQRVLESKPDVVVMLDGDGQHLPEELSQIVEPILREKADIVIGSRYIQQCSSVPRGRIIGHWAFNWITRLASGIASTDSQSGYRAFSRKAVETISFQSSGFSVESEMQFLAKENHLNLVEVPITIRYTDPPKRSVIVQGLNVLNGILHLVGQYRPMLFFGVPGTLLMALGLIWGLWIASIYNTTHRLVVGSAMLCLLAIIVGVVMLSTGFILHSIRALLISLLATVHENENE